MKNRKPCWRLTAALSVLLLVLVFPGFSQKVVVLTKQSSARKFVIREGNKVVYSLTSNPLKRFSGTLQTVTDSVLTIRYRTILISDLSSFGRRRRGWGFWSTTTIAIGTGLLISGLSPDDGPECQNCTTVKSTGEGWYAVEAGLGLAFIALGINTIARNSPHDLTGKWKLEIVDASKVK